MQGNVFPAHLPNKQMSTVAAKCLCCTGYVFLSTEPHIGYVFLRVCVRVTFLTEPDAGHGLIIHKALTERPSKQSREGEGLCVCS